MFILRFVLVCLAVIEFGYLYENQITMFNNMIINKTVTWVCFILIFVALSKLLIYKENDNEY